MNPSPQISKPQNVGGLNTSYDAIINSKSQNALVVDYANNNNDSGHAQPQPHVTMRKHTTQARTNDIAAGYIKEENHEDDEF